VWRAYPRLVWRIVTGGWPGLLQKAVPRGARSLSGRRGFTLVEVLVATAVLTTALLAAVTAFSMAARVSGTARNDTLLSFLAQEKLAEVQSLTREELTPGTFAGDFGPEYPGYEWRLTLHSPDEQNVIQVDMVIAAPEAGRIRETWFSTALF
jgi:general secretion pathway protein I